MATILVVEDDAAIRTSLVRTLTERSHAVTSAATGLDGLRQAVDDRPDLVVLDLGLPDLDGLQILSMLRAVSSVPVVVVTARDGEGVPVAALNAGADDYVVKPFGADELEARVRAVLRRAEVPMTAPDLTVGELTITPGSRVATMGERTLDLTRKEFDVLAFLASRAGDVVSKRELLAEVWRQAYGGSDRTVDVHLSWLRRKLGETADAPRYLHSVRGVGVRLAPPVDESPNPDN